MALYNRISVPSSWLKSFSDGSNQLGDLQFSMGLEYSIYNTFFFRTGYHLEPNLPNNKSYLTFGAGINTSLIEGNFSFLVPGSNEGIRNPLLNTMSLGFNFNIK